MRTTRRWFLAAYLSIACSAFAAKTSNDTILDRYVAAPDPAFKYELVKTITGDEWTAYVVDLTSGSWRTAEEVTPNVWHHWMTVVQPRTVRTSTAFLRAVPGKVGEPAPEKVDPFLVAMASSNGAVVADLRSVPPGPLMFAGNPEPLVEDSLMAASWDKYLSGGDDHWPLILPMTRSIVRAMDAVIGFCGSGPPDRPCVASVKNFVLTGGSKRGWAVWLAGAVDSRVAAIIPQVADLLNMEKSYEHHWRAYGFWAPALAPYEKMGITGRLFTKRGKQLMAMLDPYEYRHRITIPKYMINASSDEFFLPDSWQFYYGDLKGEKHLRYSPNADHSLPRGADARESVASFFQSFVDGQNRPEVSWRYEADGSTIHVKTTTAPSEVTLWQATNATARDFRLEKIGPAYRSAPLQRDDRGEYTATVLKPAAGWTAYFVELVYPARSGPPLKFTTGVRIVPDTLPYQRPKSQPLEPNRVRLGGANSAPAVTDRRSNSAATCYRETS